MSLEKLVAVSGKSGIFKMVGNRSNGLILQDLDTQKRVFASSRLHQFTPLESISIYTEDENQQDETASLAMVFTNMIDNMDLYPPVSPKASGLDIRQYFAKILPNYDRDKVLVSDIKKIIKWFNYLTERNLISRESLIPVAVEAGEEEE